MQAANLCRVLILLPAAVALSAQTPDQVIKMTEGKPEDAIIVQGKAAPKPDEVRKEAESVTRMDDFYTAPLAQIQDKVCPGVLGLPVDVAEIIVDRMRWNAERVGLEPAREGNCQPNILVAFVLSGQSEVKKLARTKGWVFRDISVEELKELIADPGPVHAWNATQTKTRGGMSVGRSGDAFAPPVVEVPISDSKIFFATRLDIAQSVVVIDIKAINGMSVVQLADYATMRAFARTRPASASAAASTILSLFDKSAPAPFELTPFDIGYLRGLYSSQGNLPASAKIGAVPKEIRKELAKASTTIPRP